MSVPTQDSDVIHRLKNHIAIIVGFCDLLLAEVPEDDPHRADIVEVHKAGRDAMALMPEVARRLQKGQLL
jgi:hypothetical protein